MSTPRTMDTVKKAAERAGEIAYEHRRRAAEAARKRAEQVTQPAGEQPHADADE